MIEQKLRRIRVQQFCWNCEEKITGLCAKCSKNKNRTPRIVEIYDAPPILKWCPCKQSVWIRCCVDPSIKPKTCQEFMWRSIMKDGTMRFKDHFCSKLCSNAEKRTGKEVFCSCGCGNKLWRNGFKLLKYKLSFVSNKHQWNYYHKLKEEKKKEQEDLSLQDLVCLNGCEGPQVHEHIKGSSYKCTKCGKIRIVSSKI